MDGAPPSVPPGIGGIGRYMTTYRGVGWLVLIGLLAWGALAYRHLAQQEDPEFPDRTAQLVTIWPGATAAQIEDLVTRPLEDAVGSNAAIEKLTSESRIGVSIIRIQQRYAAQRVIDQQWDDLRARISRTALPSGCRTAQLDTDFGDVSTLLLAVASTPMPPGETAARAAAIRNRLAILRGPAGGAGRACIVGIFPGALGSDLRRELAGRFAETLTASGLGTDCRVVHADGFSIGDFATTATREELARLFARYVRSIAADSLLHPDVPLPLLLVGDEDPLPALRAMAMPAHSFRALEVAAESLERRLRAVDGVGRVMRIGAVPEQVTILVSNEALIGRRITPQLAQAAIERRNAIVPGGQLRVDGNRYPVRAHGQFTGERDIADTIVDTAGGQAVYLRDLFEVRRGYRDPLGYRAELLLRDGDDLAQRRSIFLSVEMRPGAVIADFASAVRSELARGDLGLPEGMAVSVVSDQPRSVATRINTFATCFAEAVLIVIAVSLALMDWRSAVVVATAIPLSVAFTLAGFHVLGIPLHQISIAALIIALGLLVDFPVVATDGINRAMAEGRDRATAAWLGVWRLRRPMLYGTLINIVAFLPLALLPADKGAFIVALPIGVSLALAGALLIALALTPLVGAQVLVGQKGLEEGGTPRSLPPFSWIDRSLQAAMPRYRRLLERALDRPFASLGIAYGLLLASALLIPLFGQQFFPPAERDQIVVDIVLSEPSAAASTERAARIVQAIAARHPEITGGALFLGGSAPRFYYNIQPRVPDDATAQMLLTTTTMQAVPAVVAQMREEVAREVPGARVVVRRLEQGPPVDPPVQFRITGDDLPTLRRLGDHVAQALRDAGADRVHDDLGHPMPNLTIDVDQDRAALLGVDNASAGLVIAAAFQGVPVTDLREGDHLVPVVVRLRESERSEADRVRSLYVTTTRGGRLPLSAVADLRLEPDWTVIRRHDRRRSITVAAYPPVGGLAIPVVEKARPAIAAIALPAGYAIAIDGEAKEMAASQGEMGGIMAISLALIFLLLVMQFRSLAKAAAVMATVPLALIGAFAGLALFGASLGFMAMLAIVSLAGIVVSHIIVLSDCIEEAREGGLDLRAALLHAGAARMRPVLVTVLATVLGLIPLALRGGELWQPLAAVHIVGLLAGTALTLVVLPVIYWLMATRLKWIA
jgi:multidrug efflux pump subunit AcrB